MSRKPSQGIRSFMTFAGFRDWTASQLPAPVGTTLPSWLRPPAFSFGLSAAIESLFATTLIHAGFWFLLALFQGWVASAWPEPRLLEYSGACMIAACLPSLYLDTGLALPHGVQRSLFITHGRATLFVGALYVIPPLNFFRRMGGEIVVAEGLWVWMEEPAGSSDDEKTGRMTLDTDSGLKFSDRFGVLALAAVFFGTLIVAVFPASTPPLTLIARMLIAPVWRIEIFSWKEHAPPDRMLALGSYAFVLHLVTGMIFAASPLVTLLGKAG